jgi:hypothetical protein
MNVYSVLHLDLPVADRGDLDIAVGFGVWPPWVDPLQCVLVERSGERDPGCILLRELFARELGRDIRDE